MIFKGSFLQNYVRTKNWLNKLSYRVSYQKRSMRICSWHIPWGLKADTQTWDHIPWHLPLLCLGKNYLKFFFFLICERKTILPLRIIVRINYIMGSKQCLLIKRGSHKEECALHCRFELTQKFLCVWPYIWNVSYADSYDQYLNQ